MEENKDIPEFQKLLDRLRESSVTSKEYYKFLIGLSTGTLIFSLTFVREFIKFPQYKFILVLGWLSLLVSVLVGVWLFSKLDLIISDLTGLRDFSIGGSQKPEVVASAKGELKEYFLKTFLKTCINEMLGESYQKEKGLLLGIVEGLQEKKLKELIEKSKEIYLSKTGNKRAAKLISDTFEEVLKLYVLLSRIAEPVLYFPNLCKRLRKDLWQLCYLEKAMRYAFFIGILGVSCFSIINFLLTSQRG